MGSVAAFSGNTLPAGWLLCDGSAVSRETYATLFSVIGTTYGAGDGSTTFTLPNLIDKFIEGSATAGAVKSAGLPNITGSFACDMNGTAWIVWIENNTFYQSGGAVPNAAQATNGATQGNRESRLSFDASRSNPIYGNSNTVQPPALTMRYAIYSGVVNKKLWLRTI